MNLPTLAWTELQQWKAIVVTGNDAKSYLQGQLTCDVVTLPTATSTLGAHCDAKGKMWSIFRLFQQQQGYALWQPVSGIETALTELKKYSVFSKVDMAISDHSSLGLIGEGAEDFVNSLTDGRESVRSIEGGHAIKIDGSRWLLFVAQEQLASLNQQLAQIPQVTPSIWDELDITQGIPSLEASEQNQHIPQNLNLQAVGGISFEKGCYTGQEIVARAKYRGMNKRIMRLITGIAATDNMEFERQVGDNWRSAGTAIKHVVDQDGVASALIVVNKDLEEQTKFRLKDAPGNLWQFQALPYGLDD
ncbi:tRNA-modifying protein YgfZ [Vibrio gallicus]|uniref:tRNA-modifying protein YgfZ n=1 Tax=Vibrio gallicus TaxID=190897 RepID=UPI0021C4BE34|nr:tRNA-modifying protein YgfZ [Vibrio gallicus]